LKSPAPIRTIPRDLPALLETTTQRFQVAELSADKGYISSRNLEAVVAAGAVPYIPFKLNTTGEGPELWRKMFHFYQFSRSEFLGHYHKRSNVEKHVLDDKGQVRSVRPIQDGYGSDE
jgi:transposase